MLAPVVVLQADDVVLTEMLAVLNLHEDELGVADLVNAVRHPYSDIYRIPTLDHPVSAVQRRDSAMDDEPVSLIIHRQLISRRFRSDCPLNACRGEL